MRTPVSVRLLERILAAGHRSVTVVGTGKNVGKTVTAGGLATAAMRRGIRVGIASSGRDGERSDALDSRPKPPLVLAAGTLVATAAPLIPRTPAPEILDLAEESAIGRLALVKLRGVAACEISGPASAAALRRTVARLHAYGAELVIVDGAVDRIASLAGAAGSVVLATGVATGTTPRVVAASAADLAARLRIPVYDPALDGEPLVLEGALTYEIARRLIGASESRCIVVDDTTHVAIRGGSFARIAERLRIRVRRGTRVVACTVAASDGIAAMDPVALAHAVAAATGLPAYDLYAELAVDDAA